MRDNFESRSDISFQFFECFLLKVLQQTVFEIYLGPLMISLNGASFLDFLQMTGTDKLGGKKSLENAVASQGLTFEVQTVSDFFLDIPPLSAIISFMTNSFYVR